MRLAARLFFVGVLGLASIGSATAQNLEQFFEGIGRLGQPRRAAIEAEWERISPAEMRCVDSALRRARRSVNILIDRGIGPSDNRVAGIVSDCRSDAAIPNGTVTTRDNPSYVVNGMRLGSSVNVGSPDYLDYACAPSQQYAGYTACQRRTAERSRRRRVTEATTFLHAADGSVAYINQSLEPVVMDDNDATDEIGRLSETLGKATLLPMLDARGLPSGLIASWGTVSLQPLEPEQRAALAAGANDQPGILIDSIDNLQRSAQLGLPIYRLGGGAGYVWSASWNGRGRGTLRVVAIDASRLPGAAADASPSAETAVVAPAPEAPKPADVAPPAAASPPVAVPASPKAAEQAPVLQPPKAAPPVEVRVVGPPIALRPNTPATTSTATTAGSGSSNGLVIFLVALIVVLLGAVAYLLRKTQVAAPAAVAPLPVVAIAVAVPIPTTETVVAPESEKMDLPGLVPNESPDSIAASAPEMEVPKDAAITPAAGDAEKRDRADPSTAATSESK